MRLELRRFKHYPRLSEETVAFNADLYIDGKKSGSVKNDGHGGANFFSDFAAERKVEAWAKKQPPVPSLGGPLKLDADFAISLLVEAMQLDEEVKKLVRKMIKVAARVGATHILIASKPDRLMGYATSHPDLTTVEALRDGFESVRRFTAQGKEVR